MYPASYNFSSPARNSCPAPILYLNNFSRLVLASCFHGNAGPWLNIPSRSTMHSDVSLSFFFPHICFCIGLAEYWWMLLRTGLLWIAFFCEKQRPLTYVLWVIGGHDTGSSHGNTNVIITSELLQILHSSFLSSSHFHYLIETKRCPCACFGSTLWNAMAKCMYSPHSLNLYGRY